MLTGEVQKTKRAKPILGLLQTSKAQVAQKVDTKNHNDDADIDDSNLFDPLDNVIHEDTNDALHVADKNPIINKRILLKVNLDSNNIDGDLEQLNSDGDLANKEEPKPAMHDVKATIYNSDAFGANDNLVYDKMKMVKQYPSTATITEANEPKWPSEGRIVVYGDSNCLDSTHMEKPCFWLLDALLEYTMTSHVSTTLKDLNRSPNMQFASTSMGLPKRLPNNNLHMYSKVLLPANDSRNAPSDGQVKTMPLLKRPLQKCFRLNWETPIFMNISAPHDFHALRNKDDSDADGANVVGELNLRRKLESQKGEVRSVESLVRFLFGSKISSKIMPIGQPLINAFAHFPIHRKSNS